MLIHQWAQTILTDITYNIIHDLLLQTHREEKMARANSAAVIIEQMAQEQDILDPPSPSAPQTEPHTIQNDAATFTNPGKSGFPEVHLKKNPFVSTTEIRCGKCKLPRLLYPTEGHGARKPELGKEYCKKRPYISKPYFDIYGQTFVPEGPGRGKKKKDMINPLLAQAAKENTPNGFHDSPGASPSSLLEGLPKPIPFPHAKCQNCNAFMPIKRMNNHMAKCIGGNGRGSSKAALMKIKNGNGNGSQDGATPPGSRSGTPVPGGHSKDANRKTSPNKRDADDLDSEDSPHKKKKLMKKGILNGQSLKIKLKAPGMKKTGSQISGSNLSFEQKVPNSDDEEDAEGSGDDERDGEYGASSQNAKKKTKDASKSKFKDIADRDKKKKLLSTDSAGSKPILPPSRTSAPHSQAVNSKDRDARSESSQTLSSPN